MHAGPASFAHTPFSTDEQIKYTVIFYIKFKSYVNKTIVNSKLKYKLMLRIVMIQKETLSLCCTMEAADSQHKILVRRNKNMGGMRVSFANI